MAPSGIHCHFPTWSRDGETLYFVRGSVPDEMDIWRDSRQRRRAAAPDVAQLARQLSDAARRADASLSRDVCRRLRTVDPSPSISKAAPRIA